MPGVQVTIEFNKIPVIAYRAVPAVREAVDSSLAAIERDVKGGPHSLYKAYPPVPEYRRTGNLGRSYHSQMTGETSGEVGNDTGVAPYAIFVEFGTHKMAARPHLRPSFEAEMPKFHEKLAKALRGAMGL